MKKININQVELLSILKTRFGQNMTRHQGLDWFIIQTKLISQPEKLLILSKMEDSGGEPDVVDYDKNTDEFIYFDCSPESPKDRRSLCYDREAYNSRKSLKPKNTALDIAATIGIELLTEKQYRQLQSLGSFDLKTSSWLKTPESIRKLGGAIFADRRYDQVFVYHNGAESYYASRGFRGVLQV